MFSLRVFFSWICRYAFALYGAPSGRAQLLAPALICPSLRSGTTARTCYGCVYALARVVGLKPVEK